ncbi:MAG: hypothetical protein GX597_16290 [Anaerolineaceae bacterium]|nr:hypothetical protein [Anaerolineaceae bacterium]
MANNACLSLNFQEPSNVALFDQAFVNALLQDPVRALRDAGIEATEELLDALKQVDLASLVATVEAFETGLRLKQV